MYDIIVVGAGPAGMTAALYALRAGKSVMLIEKQVFGGQITYSPKVENYPGFEAISGNEFADKLFSQIMEHGAKIEVDEVTSVKDNGKTKTVITTTNEFECYAVIFATGAAHKRLGAPGEDELIGKGVSFCAVCDGAFFRGKDVAVVGGGNSAAQEALYLSDICNKVYLIHRRDQYRADMTLVKRMDGVDNIIKLHNTVIDKMNGDDSLESIDVKNVVTGEIDNLKVDGVFISVGLLPQNEAFSGLVKLTEQGYADVDDCCDAENGIFVAGDCRNKDVRQLTTAVGDGTVAAVHACAYVDSVK